MCIFQSHVIILSCPLSSSFGSPVIYLSVTCHLSFSHPYVVFQSNVIYLLSYLKFIFWSPVTYLSVTSQLPELQCYAIQPTESYISVSFNRLNDGAFVKSNILLCDIGDDNDLPRTPQFVADRQITPQVYQNQPSSLCYQQPPIKARRLQLLLSLVMAIDNPSQTYHKMTTYLVQYELLIVTILNAKPKDLH